MPNTQKVCTHCIHKNVCGIKAIVSIDNYCKDAWLVDENKRAQLETYPRLNATVQTDVFGNHEAVMVKDKKGKFIRYDDALELVFRDGK